MAISNTPPPQAYTREVLALAFNWLKSQPASVRERALSADALVSLYLHAKRYGTTVSPWDQDSEIGANAFKSDLKNLAQGFKDFEGPSVDSPLVQIPQIPPSIPNPSVPPPPQHASAPPATSTTTTTASTQAQAVATTQTVHQTVTTTQVKAQPVPGALLQELDSRTRETLQEVRTRLNLSSENEALRMLILLGYEKVRSLFPLP